MNRNSNEAIQALQTIITTNQRLEKELQQIRAIVEKLRGDIEQLQSKYVSTASECALLEETRVRQLRVIDTQVDVIRGLRAALQEEVRADVSPVPKL